MKDTKANNIDFGIKVGRHTVGRRRRSSKRRSRKKRTKIIR